MKSPIVIIFLCLFPVLSQAQKAIMDIHVMAVNATEMEGYQNSLTFGGGIGYDFYVNPFLSLGLEGDYLGFRYAGEDSVVNIIPLQGMINAHWNLSESFDLYAGTGIGFFWQRYKNGFSLSQSELVWGLTPRVGFNFEMAENVFLTSALEYSLTFAKPAANDANGLLIFSLGIGYNINAEF